MYNIITQSGDLYLALRWQLVTTSLSYGTLEFQELDVAKLSLNHFLPL